MSMQVKASNKIQDLTGEGLEWLVSEDGVYIRLQFFNGQIVRAAGTGDTEDTLVCKLFN